MTAESRSGRRDMVYCAVTCLRGFGKPTKAAEFLLSTVRRKKKKNDVTWNPRRVYWLFFGLFRRRTYSVVLLGGSYRRHYRRGHWTEIVQEQIKYKQWRFNCGGIRFYRMYRCIFLVPEPRRSDYRCVRGVFVSLTLRRERVNVEKM